MNSKRQPTILVLCSSLNQGGLELYVKQSAAFFKQHGVSYRLALLDNSFLATHCNLSDADFTIADFRKTHFFPFKTAQKLARYIDKESIDIIHIHFGKDLPLAVLTKHLAKRPVKLIYSRHMCITHCKFDPYHQWLYRNIDLFLGVSEQVCQQARTKLPLNKNRIKKIYLGVPAEPSLIPSREAVFASLNLDPKKFTIAIFGRIEAPKGQHTVLQAFKCLSAQRYDLQLVIVGHSMGSAFLDQLEKNRELAPNYGAIKIIPFIEHPMQWMGAFDTIIAASYQETFGLVLPEAMRCKTAVIGTNAGGIREIIEDNITGLLFEPKNVEQLIEKIRYLIENPEEKNRLANAGFAKATLLFNQETHFHALIAEYTEVAQTP